MIQLQDFLIVCNDSKKLQMIQDILTLTVTDLFEKHLRTRAAGSKQIPPRPRSFPFSPRHYNPDIAKQMWDHGTSGGNFTGAIFCNIAGCYKLDGADSISQLCEEFTKNNPSTIVNFHYDDIDSVSHQVEIIEKNHSNLNVVPTIEPIDIVLDMRILIV